MDLGLDKARLLRYKAAITKHLSDPVKLRLVVSGTLALVAIVGVYLPFSGLIEENRAEVAAERGRDQAIKDVEGLRSQVAAYEGRIGKESDANDWVQYLLSGLREYPVKLRDMESRPPQKVGPYLAVTLSVEIEGTYHRMRDLMEWLESSDRVLRVDSMRFEKRPKSLLMKITVLGLVRKNAPAT